MHPPQIEAAAGHFLTRASNASLANTHTHTHATINAVDHSLAASGAAREPHSIRVESMTEREEVTAAAWPQGRVIVEASGVCLSVCVACKAQVTCGCCKTTNRWQCVDVCCATGASYIHCNAMRVSAHV